MILTDAELKALTKKRNRDAQARVLRAMGIIHKVRPDGSIAVSRSHVEHLLGGVAPAKLEVNIEPDWSAV